MQAVEPAREPGDLSGSCPRVNSALCGGLLDGRYGLFEGFFCSFGIVGVHGCNDVLGEILDAGALHLIVGPALEALGMSLDG